MLEQRKIFLWKRFAGESLIIAAVCQVMYQSSEWVGEGGYRGGLGGVVFPLLAYLDPPA